MKFWNLLVCFLIEIKYDQVLEVVKLFLQEMKAIVLGCLTTICPLYKTVAVSQ